VISSAVSFGIDVSKFRVNVLPILQGRKVVLSPKRR
jgi:hypothetical protein